MRRPLPFFLLVAFGIALDLVSKSAVFNWLDGSGSIEIIPGIIRFTWAENRGVAFSMFKGANKMWFVVLSLLASAAFIWIYLRCWKNAHGLLVLAIGMLLVGAIGNMVDRAVFGYVRDFIDFVPEIPFIGRWAVFNVADICITVGVIFYFIAELFLAKPPGAETESTQNASTQTPSSDKTDAADSKSQELRAKS